MPSIVRLKVVWTGTPVVGGGVSVFHFAPSSTSGPAAIKAFITGFAGYMPNGITATVPNTGDTIDEASGQIDGVWTATGGGTVVSAGGTGAWAAGVGARATWFTNGITRGRRVRGATYIVPLTALNYGTDGTLEPTFLTAAGNAASTLAGVADFGVYTRPQSGSSNGAFHDVLSSVVFDKVSWLRSRRV